MGDGELSISTGPSWLMKKREPFKQGAEARLYHCIYFGQNAVIKERFSKSYRHPSLDFILTKERTRTELNALNKCRAIGIDVPAVYFVDCERNFFIMEFISDGTEARQFMENCRKDPGFEGLMNNFGWRLGEIIAKLHLNGITHGDLTTSNILIRNENPQSIVLIDFGLAEDEHNEININLKSNATVESKGVDLYVLARAVASTHVYAELLFTRIREGYMSQDKEQHDAVFMKLLEIEKRGRKHEIVD